MHIAISISLFESEIGAKAAAGSSPLFSSTQMKLLFPPPLSSSPCISLFFTWTWIICSCKIQITHNQGINLGIKEQLRWGVMEKH
ncbi:hypothetical protein ACFX1S_025073 [Malus domestica]